MRYWGCLIYALRPTQPRGFSSTSQLNLQILGKKGNIINYLISMYKSGGALISQGTVGSDVSPIDALKIHASSTGRQIEAENLEYSQDKKHWEMHEPDGTRIVVEEV